MVQVTAFKRRSLSAHRRFESLMAPHFDPLYSAARRMTLSPYDAEDLVQEVCIKAFNRLDELEQIEFQRAWLLKVMYNLFVDDRRRTARSPLDAAWTGDTLGEVDTIACHGQWPEEQVGQDQRLEQVLRAMRCLNADQCALVAMHDVEGLSIEELCKLTGKAAGTVKSQLHRTRKKLGRLLMNEVGPRPHLKVIGGR